MMLDCSSLKVSSSNRIGKRIYRIASRYFFHCQKHQRTDFVFLNNLSRNPRPMGPAELLLEATFTVMRNGGGVDLSEAHKFAKKVSLFPKIFEKIISLPSNF